MTKGKIGCACLMIAALPFAAVQRIFAAAPDWWSELNTNEQFVAEVPAGADVSIWHLPRESFASEKARKEVAPYYRRIVRHLFERYGGNLLGVHVANGPRGEDFPVLVRLSPELNDFKCSKYDQR